MIPLDTTLDGFMSERDERLTRAETAKYLGVSLPTYVHHIVGSGRVREIALSPRVRFVLKDDLDKLLNPAPVEVDRA
jgi:hypothetical protein